MLNQIPMYKSHRNSICEKTRHVHLPFDDMTLLQNTSKNIFFFICFVKIDLVFNPFCKLTSYHQKRRYDEHVFVILKRKENKTKLTQTSGCGVIP